VLFLNLPYKDWGGSSVVVHLPSVFKTRFGQHLWLIPVILAAQEGEIWRITIQSLSQKTLHKNRAGGVALSSSPSTAKIK
jgi:hypothetical protein